MERIFKAECDYFGYLEGNYKAIETEEGVIVTPFAYDFTDAITKLHKAILENDFDKTFPKAKFNIYLIGATSEKDQKVYTISSSKFKKLFR